MRLSARSLKKQYSHLLLFGCVLASILLINSTALAQFVPPPNDPPPDATDMAGPRSGSCHRVAETTLTALAPYSFVGQTMSTHPTFAWYVPCTQSFPTIFRLFKSNADGTLQSPPIQEASFQSWQGIMSFSLPADKPGLAAGQKYYWQVFIKDGDDQSEYPYVGTEIKVVDAPSELTTSLAAADILKRVDLYANAGFWYDALKDAVEASKSNGNDGNDRLLALLKDLVNIDGTTQECAQPHLLRCMQSTHLQQIVEHWQEVSQGYKSAGQTLTTSPQQMQPQ